jgi:hypothetical protein
MPHFRRYSICLVALPLVALLCGAAPALAASEIQWPFDQRQHAKAVRNTAKDLKQLVTGSNAVDRCRALLLQQEGPEQRDITCLALARAIVQAKQWQLPEAICRSLLAREDQYSDVLAAEFLLKATMTFGEPKLRHMPNSTMQLAADLLRHPDPVVQALGAWSMGQRVQVEQLRANMLRKLFTPDEESRGWYQAWQQRDPALKLADDYCRQLVQLLAHSDLGELRAELAYRQSVWDRMLANERSRPVPSALSDRHQELLAAAEAACEAGDLAQAHEAYIALRTSGRELLRAARSEWPGEGLVFVSQLQPKGGYNNVNGAVIGPEVPVGKVWRKQSADPAETPEDLLDDRLGLGSLHGIDLEWEGTRLAVSHWSTPENDSTFGFDRKGGFAGIHVLDLESGETTRVSGKAGNNDIEPCFLPDGGFFFASDRSNFGNQCAGSFFQHKRCTTLYRLPADGGEPIAISNNKDFDRFPSVLRDGTVAFMHWEYQERNFYNQHTIWRCRPDGTSMDALYKQHISYPMSMRVVKQVPDSSKLVGTAQGHHDGHYGPVVLFDPSQGINNAEAMWNVTPGVSYVEGGIGPLEHQIVAEGGVRTRGGYYIDPFPMSEEAFLVGYDMLPTKAEFALYYIDVFGNRELLHRQRGLSSFEPFALRPRQRPPVIPDTVRPDVDHAMVFLENVYNDLPGVAKGAVKYLRLSQKLFLPAPVDPDNNQYNHLHWLPGGVLSGHLGCWSWGPTRNIGTVAVEDDGSAYFKVPAGTPVYLQALDENHCEIRRMRTSFTLQRGEFRGCVGCHESRLDAVVRNDAYPSELLARGPAMPEPPSWGMNTILDYQEHVQPVLDRHCVSCHGAEKPDAGLDFSGRMIGGYLQSYRTMFGLKPEDPTPVNNLDIHFALYPDARDDAYITGKAANRMTKQLMASNEQPGQLVCISDRMAKNADITMPYEFGSNRSKLIRTLLDDPMHREKVRAKMPQEDWLKLVTWVDNSALYYSTVIDQSRYNRDGSGELRRVEFLLPSPWVPADTCPSFLNTIDLVHEDGG